MVDEYSAILRLRPAHAGIYRADRHEGCHVPIVAVLVHSDLFTLMALRGIHSRKASPIRTSFQSPAGST